MEIVEKLWDLLNSPAGIVFVAAALLYALNKIYDRRPAWRAFEGSIISAIKFAEKIISDDTKNAGLQKCDEALRYVVKVYAETRGKAPNRKLVESLREGVKIIHAQLEAAGTLGGSTGRPDTYPFERSASRAQK